MSENNKNEIIPQTDTPPAPAAPNQIQLGMIQNLDMSGLTEHQQQALRYKHAEGMLELQKRAQGLQIDVQATNANLHNMAKGVEEVSAAGNSITVTHVQKTELGQTEVIMGNTDTAQKGKITRTQRGLPDYTLIYVIMFFIVVLAAIFAFRQ